MEATKPLDVWALFPDERNIFGPVEVDPDVLIYSGVTPEEMDGGFNTRAYRVGDYVLKVSKQSLYLNSALRTAATMQDEHDLNRKFLGPEAGDHLPPTTLWVASLDGNPYASHFVTLQTFQEGKPYGEYVADPEAYTEPVVSFFKKCLAAYRATNRIADLAHIQHRFNPAKARNVIVRPDGHPVLVDTHYGKFQRGERTGWFWRRGIARGVQKEIDRLQAA